MFTGPKIHSRCSIIFLFFTMFWLSAHGVLGQSSAFPDAPTSQTPTTVSGPPAQNAVQASTPQEFQQQGKVGFGVKASLLGAGLEFAAAIAPRVNVRGGFNMFSYNRSYDKDNINYDGKISFKTIEAHLDFFPWAKSFHVSPGVLAYLADPLTADAAVAPGESFSLGDMSYVSDPSNPVTGMGKINFYRAAPMITFGWGNLVRNSETRHFSIPVELGVVFQGSPKATLNFQGSVCDAPGVNCRSIASDPTVQQQILSEQAKINNSMSFFKVYPIISVGFGYRF